MAGPKWVPKHEDRLCQPQPGWPKGLSQRTGFPMDGLSKWPNGWAFPMAQWMGTDMCPNLQAYPTNVYPNVQASQLERLPQWPVLNGQASPMVQCTGLPKGPMDGPSYKAQLGLRNAPIFHLRALFQFMRLRCNLKTSDLEACGEISKVYRKIISWKWSDSVTKILC